MKMKCFSLFLRHHIYAFLSVWCCQHVTADIWWYYMLELGFYVSLILSLFMDAKRKVRTL